jgi:uncharacterized protein (DUF111 family)
MTAAISFTEVAAAQQTDHAEISVANKALSDCRFGVGFVVRQVHGLTSSLSPAVVRLVNALLCNPAFELIAPSGHAVSAFKSQPTHSGPLARIPSHLGQIFCGPS